MKVSWWLWCLMFIVHIHYVREIHWCSCSSARTVTPVQMFVCPSFRRRLVRSDWRTASISDCNSLREWERCSTRPRFDDCSCSHHCYQTGLPPLCLGTSLRATSHHYILEWIISHNWHQNQKEIYKMLFFIWEMSILIPSRFFCFCILTLYSLHYFAYKSISFSLL